MWFTLLCKYAKLYYLLMKKKIAILGTGSAGIQSLCHFLSYLNIDWEITSIHNPNIPSLGIGESSNPSFITVLESGINYIMYEDLEPLDATLKLGTLYTNWRERSFINPLLAGSCAIHFNTNKLKDFVFPRLRTKWGEKFKEIEGNINNLVNAGQRATVTVNNTEYHFDFVIDCRGFPKDYTDYHVLERPMVNRALVYNKPGDGSKHLLTGHIATPDGWMFEVPLADRISYGYMFNDAFISTKDAKKNFSKEIGVNEDDLGDIEYSFNSFYAKRVFDGRILKNGNSALFFEPLFANSLWAYDRTNRFFFDYLIGDATDVDVNKNFDYVATAIRDMIYFHYQGGSVYDSEFWKQTAKYAETKLRESEHFDKIKPQMRFVKDTQHYPGDIFWVFDALNLQRIDKNFEYNYFK